MRRPGTITPAQLEGVLALHAAGRSPHLDARRWAVWLRLHVSVRSALERDRFVERSAERGVLLTSTGTLCAEAGRATLRWRRARARR